MFSSTLVVLKEWWLDVREDNFLFECFSYKIGFVGIVFVGDIGPKGEDHIEERFLLLLLNNYFNNLFGGVALKVHFDFNFK